jgi:hypothetical protein
MTMSNHVVTVGFEVGAGTLVLALAVANEDDSCGDKEQGENPSHDSSNGGSRQGLRLGGFDEG